MKFDLKKVLETSLANLGVRRGIKEMMAVLAWPTIVGEALAKQTSARHVQGGILFVGTAGPAWSQQLSLMRPTLLARLNAHLGERIVTDIRFSVGLHGQSFDEAAAARREARLPDVAAVSGAVQEAAALAPADFQDLVLRLGRAQMRVAARRVATTSQVCRVCGQPTGDSDLCPVCRNGASRERRLKVRAALAQNHGLSLSVAEALVPGLTAGEFRAEHDDLLVTLWNLLNRARDGGEAGTLRQAAVAYLSSRLSCPPAAVPEEEIALLARPPVARPRSEGVLNA